MAIWSCCGSAPAGSPIPPTAVATASRPLPASGSRRRVTAELAPLPSGKILVGLNDGTAAGMSFDAVFGVARFTAAGLLDSSFSGDGKQQVVAGEDQFFSDIAVADDGRIVLSGRVDSGSDADVLVARLLPGGAPDLGFGERGLVRDHRPGMLQSGGGVAVQRDRRIVVGADTSESSGGNAVLIRLLGDTRRPGTRITAGPRGGTAPGRVRFRFRVLRDVHARFQCKLRFSAGGATPAVLQRFRPCRSPLRLRAVEGRAYTFLVRAIDRAGNVDRTPAKRRFRVGAEPAGSPPPAASRSLAAMDLFLAICQAAGIGIAVGVLAAAVRNEGASAMTLMALAAGAAAVAGGFSATADDESFVIGAVAGLLGGVIAARVVGGVVEGAARRGGGGATAFLIAVAGVAIAAAAILVPFLAIVALAGIAYLGYARRRRAQRKHEGLRVLR